MQKRLSGISISRETNQVMNNYQNSFSEKPVSRQTSQSQHNLQNYPSKAPISLEKFARDKFSSSKDATTFKKIISMVYFSTLKRYI